MEYIPRNSFLQLHHLEFVSLLSTLATPFFGLHLRAIFYDTHLDLR